MWELVLPQVPVEWRSFIWMYITSLMFLVTPWIPVNNGETFWSYWVSCRVAVVVYRGWGPEVFFEPVPQRFCQIPPCIPLYIWCVGIWIYIWLTLLKFCCPCPLEPWEGFLWYWYPWNVPGSPSCCKSSWTFSPVHGCKVALWRCSYFCSCLIHCCCWVGCQWMFVHCGCCVCNQICPGECWEPWWKIPGI